GVAQQLLREGLALTGMEGVVEGNVPIASGLSSSAAMEVAALMAFQVLGGWELDGAKAALLCQRAENEFMGVRVGIMDQFISRLETVPGRRARHVVSEDDRVLRAVAALRGGRLAEFGALMNDSHESLRFDYEVSSRQLNILVDAARQVEGCAGARLTGAGFGG